MAIPVFAFVEPEDRAGPPPGGRQLDRTRPGAAAAAQLALGWRSREAGHTDCYVANELDLEHGILPATLEADLLDRPVGYIAAHRFPAGELAESYRDDRLQWVRNEQFTRRLARGAVVEPRRGRFYPKGILEGGPGVSGGNLSPFRVTELEEGRFQADLNHPLAGHGVELQVKLLEIGQTGDARAGTCKDLAGLAAGNGPGMQARWRGRPTDFWSDLPFARADPSPDDRFYAEPRMVQHLDSAARRQIGRLYAGLIPHGGRVLDLMASWTSHLPADLETGPVTGLGMNRAELDANGRLAERVVHDLNRDARLPFADHAFDAVICTASVEYLISPFEVFAEAARVLRPGGRFVVTFSNRRFPPKVIRVWETMHEFERPGLVMEYFLQSGRFAELETYSLRGLPRPADDKYAGTAAFSDPVFAVWGAAV